MSWKKYFTQVPVRNNQTGQLSPVGSATGMPSGPAKTIIHLFYLTFIVVHPTELRDMDNTM